MTQALFALTPQERREFISDIQKVTFRHLDPEVVDQVTCWALTINSVSDDTVINMWQTRNDLV